MKSSSSSRCYYLPLLLISSATAILWPSLGPNFWKNNQPSFTKICLYSTDPKQFTPICIMCPNTLYPIVLTTCVMGVAIPLNVSYTQANCIVGNCAVNQSPQIKKGRREAVDSTLVDTRSYLDEPFPADMVRNSAVDASMPPYTMMVDGHNVTITSVEEYYVHSDDTYSTDDYELVI